MKNMICALLALLFCVPLSAQREPKYLAIADNYECHYIDTCEAVVIAPSGLKLRAQPSFSAKAITVIPFGKKVRHLKKFQGTEPNKVVFDADSIPGNWLKLFWQGKEGYAFSAYLGRGILKMDQPFYLLAEKSAWCWDDSYISSDYHYYGVYPNADTSSLTIRKAQPLFYNNRAEGNDGITFSLRQKRDSYFAFASKEPFEEAKIRVFKSRQRIGYQETPQPDLNQKIQIPYSDWELKMTMAKVTENGETYDKPRLIIRDKKTGSWHYLMDSYHSFEMVELLWCGDMDGDGVQDFMLNVGASHYGGMVLFLSKNQGKWKFVKMAGAYFGQDCC